MDRSEQDNLKLRQADQLDIKGYVQLWDQNYMTSLSYFTRALQLRIEVVGLQNDVIIANSHYNIGQNLRCNEQFENAEKHYKVALKMYQAVQEKNYLQTLNTYFRLGEVQRLMGNYKQSLINYHLALDGYLQVLNKNDPQIGNTYYGIAEDFKLTQQYNLAIDQYVNAKRIYVVNSNLLLIANSIFNIALCHRLAGDFTQAIEDYHYSVQVYKKLKNASDKSVLNQIGNAHFGSGQSYVALENYYKAKQFFEYALDDYIRSGNEEMINLCKQRIQFCEYNIQQERK